MSEAKKSEEKRIVYKTLQTREHVISSYKILKFHKLAAKRIEWCKLSRLKKKKMCEAEYLAVR